MLATALDLARTIRKTGVVSKVCYGFIGNRMMDPYGREAERCVLEGATPQEVDDALESFGMAMGILAVYDMAGVDIGHLTRLALGDAFDERPDVLSPVGHAHRTRLARPEDRPRLLSLRGRQASA